MLQITVLVSVDNLENEEVLILMRKTQIFFSSKAFMVLCFFLGIVLIVLCEEFGKYFQMQLVITIIRILAETLISISALDFFLSISTERELLYNLQTKICEDTDFSKLNNLNKQHIIQKIVDIQLAPDTEEYKEELSALSKDIGQEIWDTITEKIFIRKFKRDVDITLMDDNEVIVRTATIMHFCNPSGKRLLFRQQPTFITENEAYSFRILSYKYNEKEEYKLINKEPRAVYDSTSFSHYKTIPAIIHNLSKKGDHYFEFLTEYKTNYDNFFQTDVLKYNCHYFDLSALVQDRRTKNKNKYFLKWQIICHPAKKYHLASNKVQYNIPHTTSTQSDNNFETLGSICWFPKYSGYVLTLNQVPETTNPKKQKIAKSVKRFLYNTLNKKIRVNEKR